MRPAPRAGKEVDEVLHLLLVLLLLVHELDGEGRLQLARVHSDVRLSGLRVDWLGRAVLGGGP